MKNRKNLSSIIITLSSIFIIAYLGDGVKEICVPCKGLGFSYKSLPFYFLKLIYACILLWGGIDLLKGRNRSLNFMMFSSIGILISCGWFWFNGYIFRTTPLDYFFLEGLSFLVIILCSIKYFREKFEINQPKNWLMLVITFVGTNLILNYLAWWLLKNYNL